MQLWVRVGVELAIGVTFWLRNRTSRDSARVTITGMDRVKVLGTVTVTITVTVMFGGRVTASLETG